MAWTDLTITRSNINAYAGEDLKNISAGGNLDLGANADLTLARAKALLKSDVTDHFRYLITEEEEYTTVTALLDAIYAANTDNFLEDLLVFKFLELWFYQDAEHEQSKTFLSFKKYRADYTNYLKQHLDTIGSSLSRPSVGRRYRFVR